MPLRARRKKDLGFRVWGLGFREDAFESTAKEDSCCRILAATVLYAPHVVEHLLSFVWCRV